MTEPHTQPPEPIEREPTRFDDIDFDTVSDWRDKMKHLVMQCGYGTGKGTGVLIAMLESMNKTLDDAQGFNDPQPERDDDWKGPEQ